MACGVGSEDGGLACAGPCLPDSRPLCAAAPSPQGGVDLGRIASLEKDHKAVEVAKKGDTVAMKIEVGAGGEAGGHAGREGAWVGGWVEKGREGKQGGQ